MPKSDTAAAAFGRFNPPTKGHLKLVNKLTSIPGDHYLFISHTQDAEKNPLDYDTKVSYAKKFFEGVHIGDKGCETIYDVLNKLRDMGYEHLVYVCGEDEYVPFGKIINEYNEKNNAFESVKIVQAGDRDEDSEGTDGISATKVRQLAKDGDYEEFCDSIPDRKYAKGLYNDLRSAMKLDEDVLDEIEPNDIDMADAKAISGPIHKTILNAVNKNLIDNVPHITVDGIQYSVGLYPDPKYPNTTGVYVHNKGDIVAQLDLEPTTINILGTNFEIMIVDYAMVGTNYQRKNIGFTLYKDLITKAQYNLGAYKTQSPGAQLLWKKLFTDSEISLCASNDFSNKRGKVEVYPVVMGPDGNLAAKVKGKVVSLYGLGNTMGIIATVKGGALSKAITPATSDLAKKVRSEQVDEAHVYWKYWGWISPEGKIITPFGIFDNFGPNAKSSKLIPATVASHQQLIQQLLGNSATESSAKSKGYVRWLVEPGTNKLLFDVINIKSGKIFKGIESVTKEYRSLERTKSDNNFKFESLNPEREIAASNSGVFITELREFLVNEMNEDIEHSEKGWTLFSKKTHKRLGGPYASKEQAIKRERQVAYFKHMGENKIKTFKQFSEEQEELPVDPKGDQEVLLEVTAPKEVKDNATDGLELRSKFNRGGNSDTIKTANKLLKEPFDESDLKNLLVNLTWHEKEKKTGWDDPEAPSDGFIAWMMLGGDAGKLWAEKSLSSTGKSIVKEESLNEVSPEGIAAMRRMGMQQDPEGDLARANYEKITKTKWSPPEDTNKKQPTPETSKTKSELASFLSQTLGFEYKKEEIIPGRLGMVRYEYSNSGKVYKEVSGWTLRVYYRRMRQTTSQPIGVTGWYLFSPDSEVDVYDSGKTMEQLISVVKELKRHYDPNPK